MLILLLLPDWRSLTPDEEDEADDKSLGDDWNNDDVEDDDNDEEDGSLHECSCSQYCINQTNIIAVVGTADKSQWN